MKRLTLLLAAIFCVLPQAMAQDASTITLQTAVQTALDKNINVIEARNSVTSSVSSERQAFGNYLPSLNADGNYSHTTSWVNPNPGVGSSNWSAGLSSNVTLFNGFANVNNVKRAAASTRTAEYSLTRTQQSTVYNTHQLFLNVVRSFQLLGVSNENLKRSQRQLERISESNKVGAVALADVYRQQVQVGSDELAAIQAQSNYEKSKADVLAFLGVDVDREYIFDFKDIPTDIDTSDFAAMNLQYGSFSDLVKAALEHRPDRQAATASLAGSEASLSAAKGAWFPTVSGQGSYGYGGPTFGTMTDSRSLNLSVGVSLPIFNGFQTQNQVQQAEIAQNNAVTTLEQNKRVVTVDVRKSLLDLEAAEKAIRVTQSSVKSAELDRKIAEEKYSLGSGTLLDLLIANANYTQALSNKVNAVNDYLLAKKGVEFAIGTITQ